MGHGRLAANPEERRLWRAERRPAWSTGTVAFEDNAAHVDRVGDTLGRANRTV
ncbi:MAG: hypothetical protein IPM16_00170 [Chloroflexi bacterium]|nr:hypothetical protein [Chloroflexota bacterium]